MRSGDTLYLRVKQFGANQSNEHLGTIERLQINDFVITIPQRVIIDSTKLTNCAISQNVNGYDEFFIEVI